MKASVRVAMTLGAALGRATAAQADPQALSRSAPVTVEDALPTATGKAEIQLNAVWDHTSHDRLGRDLVTSAPTLKLGAAKGLQLELSAPYALGDASGRDQGSVTFGGLYQLSDQGEVLPAFAVHEDYAQGFGLDGGSSVNTLRLAATKSLGDREKGPRLHANLTWIRLTDPTATQRRDRYEAIVGYSQPVGEHTAFVADYVHAQNAARGSASNLIEAGLRHELNEDWAVSGGAGVGLGQQSPDFRLLLALQYDFKAF